MARDRRGVVIAWTMYDSDFHDRISVARLDITGHIAGSIRSIPVASPNPVEAIDPSIAVAPNGDGFTLVWMEIPLVPQYDQRLALGAYCHLDPALTPSAPSLLLSTINAPPIVSSGKTTWITAGHFVWQVRENGSLASPLNGGIDASDMTIATGFPQTVSGRRVRGPFICTPRGHSAPGTVLPELCTGTYTYFYALQFVSLYTILAEKQYSFDSNAQPAINSDGHDVLIAWFRGAESSGGEVVAARLDAASGFQDFPHAVDEPRFLAAYPFDSGPRRPAIASDGERYVVVWRTMSPLRTFDIAGAAIDRAGNVVPLSIATSEADERDPSVIALGNGTFLVAYEKWDAGGRHIAGRFVTFEPRSHAVR